MADDGFSSVTASVRPIRLPLRWVKRSFTATRNRFVVTQRSIRRVSWRGRNSEQRLDDGSTVSTTAISASKADIFTRPVLTVAAESLVRAVESGKAAFTRGFNDLVSIVNKDDEEESEVSARGFPTRFTPIHSTTTDLLRPNALTDSQELTATGCKHWGSMWDGRGLFRIRIYDFAVYANPVQVQSVIAAPSARRLARWSRRAPQIPSVVPNLNVEMSLTVRPARDLPLDVMAAEYNRILRKRMTMNGWDPEDAALKVLIKFFDPAALPPGSTTRRGHIKKDTALSFCRSKAGTLTAVADGSVLATVSSQKLCEAVFDLYLGENPVCKKAKLTAGRTLTEMLTQPLSARTIKI